MTETTKQRIERILGVHYDWTGRVIEAGLDTAAEKIAADIDHLTERNAFLLASAEAAQANLAACRRELAEARAYISTTIDAPGERV